MNLHEEALILLVIFETLIETRSVSKANERLNLSQLSMSNALARLRRMLHRAFDRRSVRAVAVDGATFQRPVDALAAALEKVREIFR